LSRIAGITKLDFGVTKWSNISQIFQTTTIVPPHGLKGKEPSRSNVYNELLGPLNNHLDELCDCGEPVATRIV
jgi:hypothetical protein